MPPDYVQSLLIEKAYHQAPGSSDEWSDEWFDRAVALEEAIQNRQGIDAQRAERDAAIARGRKG